MTRPEVGSGGAGSEVAVLGEVAVDLVAQVDRLPERGGFALARSYSRFAGGSAGNVAAGLARMGCRVSFFGELGDDPDGRFLIRAFKREGVDTSNVLRVPGWATPRCMVLVERGGSRVIIGLPRSRTEAETQDFDLDLIRRSQCVFFGPAHTDLSRKVVEAVDLRSALKCYAPGGLCHCLDAEDLMPVVSQMDVLLLNEGEALALTGGRTAESAAEQLIGAGPDLVAVTLGSRGVLIALGQERYRVRSVPVSSIRDKTGAGDAFAAGFVASYLRHLDPQGSAHVGSAAAALTIQRLGARTGMPTWKAARTLAEAQFGHPVHISPRREGTQ